MDSWIFLIVIIAFASRIDNSQGEDEEAKPATMTIAVEPTNIFVGDNVTITCITENWEGSLLRWVKNTSKGEDEFLLADNAEVRKDFESKMSASFNADETNENIYHFYITIHHITVWDQGLYSCHLPDSPALDVSIQVDIIQKPTAISFSLTLNGTDNEIGDEVDAFNIKDKAKFGVKCISEGSYPESNILITQLDGKDLGGEEEVESENIYESGTADHEEKMTKKSVMVAKDLTMSYGFLNKEIVCTVEHANFPEVKLQKSFKISSDALAPMFVCDSEQKAQSYQKNATISCKAYGVPPPTDLYVSYWVYDTFSSSKDTKIVLKPNVADGDYLTVLSKDTDGFSVLSLVFEHAYRSMFRTYTFHAKAENGEEATFNVTLENDMSKKWSTDSANKEFINMFVITLLLLSCIFMYENL